LKQRVEQVLDGDRGLSLHTFAKLFPREDLLSGEARRELDDVPEPELPEPLVLEHDPSVLARHDEMELIEVRLGVPHDVVAGFERPALVEIARVPDLSRPIPDDE